MTPKHPLLAPWPGPHGGIPPFDEVTLADLKPGLELGMEDHLKEVQAIADQSAAPTFENTIAAMERSGHPLSRAATVFGIYCSSLSTPEVRALEAEMSPKLAAYGDKIVQNSTLFARIKAVYETRASAGLNDEQQRLTWVLYTSFVKQGAALDATQKAELSRLNQSLASLTTQFSQNQLADEETKALIISRREDLAGLSSAQIADAAAEASRRGLTGQWAIANTRSAMEPFLCTASNRTMREQGWRLWTQRGDNGDANDNNSIAAEILRQRAHKAKLLGFSTYAHWKLSDSMAKDPQVAFDLLKSVWRPAVAAFQADLAQAQAIADTEGAGTKLEPWDYRYYAEKVRQAKYELDVSKLQPYLQLERIRESMFWVAQKLYGLTFTLTPKLPVFHPEVQVYEVTRLARHVGYWYFDPYGRAGKQSGAWMSAYREQHRLEGEVATIVSNNSNFIKGAPGQPVTISWDDARTMFHEFGHALHGLSSSVTYPSLSGTNTTRDFVELPSQFHEHYLSTPEVLKFLVDEQGTPIPAALLERLEKAKHFNQGFATAEALSSALVDMMLHLSPSPPKDLKAFERQALTELGMPPALVMRHRIPHFGHIFSGDGYAAGYYSYLWAEVLEHDAFEAFTEAKGPYDAEVAERFTKHIMSVGNTIDPAKAFAQFRGRPPKPEALLRAKGFST